MIYVYIVIGLAIAAAFGSVGLICLIDKVDKYWRKWWR